MASGGMQPTTAAPHAFARWSSSSKQAVGTEPLCSQWRNAVPTPPAHSEAISFFPD